MTAMVRRRILLLEDQALMRGLVAETLRGDGFEVSAHGAAADALDALDGFDPDALVADIDLGSHPDGAQTALIVRTRSPHVAVIFLTNYPRAASAPHAVSAIPDAVFVNKASLETGRELIDAIDAAMRQHRRHRDAVDAVDGGLAGLTRTQLETLALIANGLSNAEIARRSGRTLRAVERLITRTFEALGVGADAALNSRVAAANRYIRAFGVPDSERLG